jgi:hypothetical protein
MMMPCGCSAWPTGYPWAPYYYPFYYYPYPYWQEPWVPPSPGVHGPVILPQELVVDATSPTKQVFVGGESDVNLILEYMPSVADAGVVFLSITEAGKTFEWTDKDIPAGYHVKHDFQTVAPGATIQVKVEDVVARLRWCEVVEY